MQDITNVVRNINSSFREQPNQCKLNFKLCGEGKRNLYQLHLLEHFLQQREKWIFHDAIVKITDHCSSTDQEHWEDFWIFKG